jgi:hypothetical protein
MKMNFENQMNRLRGLSLSLFVSLFLSFSLFLSISGGSVVWWWRQQTWWHRGGGGVPDGCIVSGWGGGPDGCGGGFVGRSAVCQL